VINFQLSSDYIPRYCTLTLLQIWKSNQIDGSTEAKLLMKKKNSTVLENETYVVEK